MRLFFIRKDSLVLLDHENTRKAHREGLIYREFGSADELEWTDGWTEPKLLPDSVLVRVIAGLGVAGRIVAVGSEVSGFSVGDAHCHVESKQTIGEVCIVFSPF